MKVTFEQWEEASKQIDERKTIIWELMDKLANKEYKNSYDQYTDMITVGNLAKQQKISLNIINRMKVVS